MKIDDKNIVTNDNKSKKFWKEFGIVALSLALAIFSVLVINL